MATLMGSDLSSSLWFLVLQWAYALWQAVRNTRGFNLIFYTLQWLGSQWLIPAHRSKTVVWVNKEHRGDTFGTDWEAFKSLVLHKNIEGMNVEFLEFKDYWYQVKYRGKHFWVHQDVLFELYMYDLRNCVFVKDLYDLDSKYAVAEKISEEEAMLLMFNIDMHFYPVKTKHVIYGQEINIEYNSKLSGFLSTIPLALQLGDWGHWGQQSAAPAPAPAPSQRGGCTTSAVSGRRGPEAPTSALGCLMICGSLLCFCCCSQSGFCVIKHLLVHGLIVQARGWARMSAWASLILLLIDVFRTPMYRAYDVSFFHLTKFVKLRVFMQTTWLYTLFGLFSDRWRYSDVTQGYAYLTHQGQEIEVTSFVSSSAKDDCTLSSLRKYHAKSPDMQHFCIRDGVITSGGYNYGQYSAIFKVKKGMFVT